jgi:hypothetical protein
MNTGGTGNIGSTIPIQHLPSGKPLPPNLQHLFSGTPPPNLNFGDYRWALNPQPFARWEVVLTVVAAVVMVATVVLLVRRIRPN